VCPINQASTINRLVQQALGSPFVDLPHLKSINSKAEIPGDPEKEQPLQVTPTQHATATWQQHKRAWQNSWLLSRFRNMALVSQTKVSRWLQYMAGCNILALSYLLQPADEVCIMWKQGSSCRKNHGMQLTQSVVHVTQKCEAGSGDGHALILTETETAISLRYYLICVSMLLVG
jgi:hypothetical protein